MTANRKGLISAAEALGTLTEQLETRITQWKHASDYSIDLQRLIEAFCHGRELPSPDLHHSKMLNTHRDTISEMLNDG